MDQLLSLEQAAEILGTSVRFVHRLVAERRITYIRLGKVKHVRIYRSDLDAFIASGRVQAGGIPIAHTRRAA
ncbi:helix-turn-helix domain-containing protein [Frankia sp. CiP3]|uniref:helix-turn-helix domain-containing protein n=1 Tax=Frankia sp. CiP3 TaxID=2880971 RepID=UPI001EF5C623|nr:helix-turn-helix domain-containing protein [Frankia sp. CiP3]